MSAPNSSASLNSTCSFNISNSVCVSRSEGSAKFSRKDRKRFYNIALGSLRECQSILDIIKNTQFIKEADMLGAHLYQLAQKT